MFGNYKPITTFWEDFSIAERFDKKAIIDTAKRAYQQWKDDYKYLTELVMVLNHKCWYWNNENDELMELYRNLYYEYDARAIKYLEKDREAISYYFRTLD